MKRCPACNRVETDDALAFCRADGTALISDSGSVGSEAGTVKFNSATAASEIETSVLPHTSTTPEINRAIGPTTALAAAEIQGTTQELRKPKQLRVAIALTALVVVTAVIGYFYFSRKNNATIQSIAVMPFANDSGNADVEYLSDGMTETLISSLSQLPNLNVKPRSSVFRYKGKETNPQTIGKELNVQAILNGRVVQRGQDLSLFVELIDVALDMVVWSQQYNRKQTDLVTLQSEIARDVSNKLKTKLSGADAAKVEKTYTANAQAYQLYLKGRFQWNKRTGESLRQAVEFYNQAIERDPNYALAYSGLAESYVLFPFYSVASSQESMPKARAAAVRALEIDDSLAEAHVALGLYLSTFSWNQPAAEKEFRRAIELNPNYPTAHQQFGNSCLLSMGRFDESIAEGRRAEELDPLSPVISADLGWSLFLARRYDEAIIQLKRTLTLDPNFYLTHRYLAIACHTKGNYAEAIGEYRKALALNDDPWVKALLGRSLAKSGQRGEAIKMLGELQSESAHRYVPSASLAVVYAALGEKDKAFVWLEKDVAERSPRPPLFSVNPVFDDLRDDPRFTDLVRRVALAKVD
jgi:TolB-like protein/Tfp pilus assembly protein PilF